MFKCLFGSFQQGMLIFGRRRYPKSYSGRDELLCTLELQGIRQEYIILLGIRRSSVVSSSFLSIPQLKAIM